MFSNQNLGRNQHTVLRIWLAKFHTAHERSSADILFNFTARHMLQNRDETMVAGHYSPRDPVTQPDRVTALTAAQLRLDMLSINYSER